MALWEVVREVHPVQNEIGEPATDTTGGLLVVAVARCGHVAVLVRAESDRVLSRVIVLGAALTI